MKKTKIIFKAVITMVLVMPGSSFLTACVSGNTRANHAILIENNGEEDLQDFQLTYGEYHFPMRPDGRFVVNEGRHYTMALPIPKQASVIWKTADGQSYNKTVDIQSKWHRLLKTRGNLVFSANRSHLNVYFDQRTERFKYKRIMLYADQQ